MSRKNPSGVDHAPVFAALGDDTRLSLVARLANGRRHSISQLAAGSQFTRQAITKHLHVLEGAGIVHSVRAGRESLFALDPQPIQEVAAYLDLVSKEWDMALERLKNLVDE